MNKIIVYLILGTLCVSCKNTAFLASKKAKSIDEPIEWTHSWVSHLNEDKLPRVLLIGDSHVEGYYPLVEKELEHFAYTSKLTTSRSLGDPIVLDQIELMLKQFKFTYIVFNNGLHGKMYSAEEYREFLPLVNQLFVKYGSPKLLWVNTTAWRNKDKPNTFIDFNDNIVKRNEYVKAFTEKNQIPLLDFYKLSVHNPHYYSTDGVHFNTEGKSQQAKKIANYIREH